MTSILRRWVLTSLVFFLCAAQTFADGKMYSREKVSTTIPYQRAAIFFDEGFQTMILQSQYQIPGSPEKESLGWVVPVPAPPEIASMGAFSADMLFSQLDGISGPKVTLWGRWLLFSFWFISLALAVSAFSLSWNPKLASYKHLLRLVSLAAVVACASMILIAPWFIRQSKGSDGVEVIKSQKAGIFDVQVVRAESPMGLINWLNLNSFKFGSEDEKAIRAYLDRKWCFVVAKIDPLVDPSNKQMVSSKLLAPLVLRFPTRKPVYPTALTATGGHPTEILIYLMTAEPMTTDAPLVMRFRGPLKYQSSLPNALITVEPEEFLYELPWDLGFLSKFKATFTSAQMEKDIEFYPDPGGQPFREHLIRF